MAWIFHMFLVAFWGAFAQKGLGVSINLLSVLFEARHVSAHIYVAMMKSGVNANISKTTEKVGSKMRCNVAKRDKVMWGYGGGQYMSLTCFRMNGWGLVNAFTQHDIYKFVVWIMDAIDCVRLYIRITVVDVDLVHQMNVRFLLLLSCTN